VRKLAGIGSQIDKFASKAYKEIDGSFRKKVLAIWTDTVRGTPRITGTLRANWQIGINQQNNNKLKPGQVSGDVKSLKFSDTAIIFNNMEYADAVENGIPGTARVPRKMLANAIAAARLRNKLR
jgi:hypothetical protein